LASDIRRKLEEDATRRAELAALHAEADAISAAVHLPANSEADLVETVARHAEAQRNLEGLETRRRDEQAKERAELEATLSSLESYGAATPEDADRCLTLAAEMRRLSE